MKSSCQHPNIDTVLHYGTSSTWVCWECESEFEVPDDEDHVFLRLFPDELELYRKDDVT